MTTQTPWYRTGTVAVTAGSKSVTGTGSAWQSQVLAGDLFGLTDANGNLTTALAEVESVSSDTALTLKSQWPGSTLSGQKYAIIRNFTGSLPADLAARLSKLIAQYQISVDELTDLLTSSGTVTLTTLTGETVSVQGMAGITTRLTAVESALAAKLDDSQATAAGLALLGAADVAAQRSTLGLANHQLVSVDAAGHLSTTGAVLTSGGFRGWGATQSTTTPPVDHVLLDCTGGLVRLLGIKANGNLGLPIALQQYGYGNVLLGRDYDDGVNRLQVAGGVYFGGIINGVRGSKTTNNTHLVLGTSEASDPFQMVFGSGIGYGFVQSVEQGVAYRPLVLQPDGSRVLIGTTTDDGVNIAQLGGGLRVDGNVNVRAGNGLRLYNPSNNGYATISLDASDTVQCNYAANFSAGLTVPNCADDAAAAAIGVQVGAIYRTGTTLKVRAA